jgi:hypothetical protein
MSPTVIRATLSAAAAGERRSTAAPVVAQRSLFWKKLGTVTSRVN